MKKLILNSVLSSLIFFGVGFFVIKGFAALSNVSSGTPLSASNWNNMISNFFWGSGSGGIYYNGGNVGIGISSGTSKLGIKSSGDGHGILIQANGNTNIVARLVQNNTDDGKLYLYSAGTITTDINGNGTSYFNGGNVGIGTASPTSKLDVSGVITGLPVYGRRGTSNANNLTTTPDYYIWTGGYTPQAAYFSKSADGKAIIVNKAGAYLIIANVLQYTNSSRCDASLTINGGPVSHSLSPANSTSLYKHHFSEIIQLNAGDAIRVYAGNNANCQIYADNATARDTLNIYKLN